MGTTARREAEVAWANLAGRRSSLLHLDQYAGIERVGLLAGFAARGLTGFSQLHRMTGELLRESEEAIPEADFTRLTSTAERMLVSLRTGDDGQARVRPESVAPLVGPASGAADLWASFHRAVAEHVCELLVHALLAGHANDSADLERRSACLRAACSTFWVLENEHYGPVQAPSLARRAIEELDLSSADELRPLLEAVRMRCSVEQLLEQLERSKSPRGDAASWQFASDYRTCIWGSKRFLFSDAQSKIIRALWEERHKTDCGLGVDALRKRAKLTQLPSGVSSGGIIRHCFRTSQGMHPCWDAMLKKRERDLFELVAPTT